MIHGASAASLVSGTVRAARAKAEEKEALLDDESVIMSDSGALEYAQPYNK
jgi:hypothetical protein